jgi:hypothetical protein
MKKEIYTAHMDDLMPLIRESLAAGQSVCFSPKGISMLPMLRQGRDTVTLSPITGKLKKYDLPLYQRTNGKYVLHRIVEVEDTYTCSGDNQVVLERGLKHEQMIAVVTAFTRDGKEHSVNECSYRFYCRLWHHTRLLRRIWRGLKRRGARIFNRRK